MFNGKVKKEQGPLKQATINNIDAYVLGKDHLDYLYLQPVHNSFWLHGEHGH